MDKKMKILVLPGDGVGPEVTLEANLVIDYEADSVDVVAMLLYLEDMFKNASETTRTVVPTDKLGQIVLVEDILDIIYEVLLGASQGPRFGGFISLYGVKETIELINNGLDGKLID